MIKVTSLSEEFDLDAYRSLYGDSAILLFVLEGKVLRVSVAGERLNAKAGQTVVAVVDPAEEATAPRR